ncbi:Hypothetical predicted protein [Octopus vulgaris]|uniref:Uncharacterized protein n=1 Tax=Octopus vulgaris TaxID=6645 RepID=A0AA36B3S4_OCTVU|nr:Hypothetical predicted protein [Octopus vulgaris]
MDENSNYWSDDGGSSVYMEERFTEIVTKKYRKGKSWLVGCETFYSTTRTQRPGSHSMQTEGGKRRENLPKENVKHDSRKYRCVPFASNSQRIVEIKGGKSVFPVKDTSEDDNLNQKENELGINNVIESEEAAKNTLLKESICIKGGKEIMENGNISMSNLTLECDSGREKEKPVKGSLGNDKTENERRTDESSSGIDSPHISNTKNCQDVLLNLDKTDGTNANNASNTSNRHMLGSNKRLTVENWIKHNMRLETHHKFRYYIQNIDFVEVNRVENMNCDAFVHSDDNTSPRTAKKKGQEQGAEINVGFNSGDNTDFFMCASIFLFGNINFHDKLRQIIDIFSMRLDYNFKCDDKDPNCRSKLLGHSTREDKQILAFSVMFMTKVEALVRVSNDEYFWKAYDPPGQNRSSRTMHVYYYAGNYCDLIVKREPFASVSSENLQHSC